MPRQCEGECRSLRKTTQFRLSRYLRYLKKESHAEKLCFTSGKNLTPCISDRLQDRIAQGQWPHIQILA